MTFLEYMRILKKWRKFILFVVGISLFVAGWRSFFTPRVYAAYVTSLIPQEGTQIFGQAGAFLGLSRLGGSRFETVESILASRRMARDIINHFGLQKRYPENSLVSLEKKVMGSIHVLETRYGFIVKVVWDSPQMAADVANFSVSNLDKINDELSITPSKPMARILDAAIPPLYPESRKIKEKVVVVLLGSSAGSGFFAFLVEYFRRLQEKERKRGSVAAEDLAEEILLKSQ